MKHSDVCNLVSNGSEKKFLQVCKLKCGKRLTASESRQRAYRDSLYLLCEIEVFQNKKLKTNTSMFKARTSTTAQICWSLDVMRGPPWQSVSQCSWDTGHAPLKGSLPPPNYPLRTQAGVRRECQEFPATSCHPSWVLTSPGGKSLFGVSSSKESKVASTGLLFQPNCNSLRFVSLRCCHFPVLTQYVSLKHHLWPRSPRLTNLWSKAVLALKSEQCQHREPSAPVPATVALTVAGTGELPEPPGGGTRMWSAELSVPGTTFAMMGLQ